MATMKDIITSPLLLILVIIGLLYIVGFSLMYLKKAYNRCLELGISKEDLKTVIKSSVVFSIVPSLSIVVGDIIMTDIVLCRLRAIILMAVKFIELYKFIS